MTCSIAWFEPATGEYGVAADRQFTNSQFSALHFADKTATVQAPGHDPLHLAFAGDYCRVRHVQRWIKEHQSDRVLESPDGVERFLLELHACASDGPRVDDLDSKTTGRSGVHVVAAHGTGLYKMESYAGVFHTPATPMHRREQVTCVGSGVEFVMGFFWARTLWSSQPMSENQAIGLVKQAHLYLPQSIGQDVDVLTHGAPSPSPPAAE